MHGWQDAGYAVQGQRQRSIEHATGRWSRPATSPVLPFLCSSSFLCPAAPSLPPVLHRPPTTSPHRPILFFVRGAIEFVRNGCLLHEVWTKEGIK